MAVVAVMPVDGVKAAENLHLATEVTVVATEAIAQEGKETNPPTGGFQIAKFQISG